MKPNIGLVVVNFDIGEPATVVKERLTSAVPLVPAGRCLVVLYVSNSHWSESIPYESIVVRNTVGAPEHRSSAQFEFFANGVTRAYKFEKGTPKFVRTFHWQIVRRLGDRAYTRRLSLNRATLQDNELPVLHKVFTRDVANNVWHLRDSMAHRGTINRLSRLLAWSDERVAVSSASGLIFRKVNDLNLDNDLVGVADRTPYDIGRVLGLELF